MSKSNNGLFAGCVLLRTWLIEHNLLEAEHDEIEFKQAVAWFKRHLVEVTIYTPKKNTPFVSSKQADTAYLAYSGTLEATNRNKQIAALKLDAKNTGMRIAVRAKLIEADAIKPVRQEFWKSENGKLLNEYCLQLKYSLKPELCSAGFKTQQFNLPAAIYSVLKDEEKLGLANLSVLDEQKNPAPTRGKPGRKSKAQKQLEKETQEAQARFATKAEPPTATPDFPKAEDTEQSGEDLGA